MSKENNLFIEQWLPDTQRNIKFLQLSDFFQPVFTLFDATLFIEFPTISQRGLIKVFCWLLKVLIKPFSSRQHFCETILILIFSFLEQFL